MDQFIEILVYVMGGYMAAYFLLRPSALIEAIAIGPGLSPAAWAYHKKHYQLTYPLLAMLLVLLGAVVVKVA